uniref:Arylsulfatase A n=1 Tax=Neolamprologus brichardi TaxID=32507 RepID=A0A3Q4M2S1_NEOBR
NRMVSGRVAFFGIILLCTCSASPSLTPNLNRLAAEGLRFTDFYSTCPVCSPSRASLLTGRYQTRSGIYPGVLYPGSIGGLPLNDTTIAEVLKPLGYATAVIGKWHLGVGHNGMFLPTKQGFDHFLGIPYSHDMGPCKNLTCFPPDIKCYGLCDISNVVVPLMENEVIKQQPVNFLDLERSYSDFAANFITTSVEKKQPFFLYYPSHHTHYPQYAGIGAAGRSLRGPYGDSLLEFDTSVGHLVETLERTGVINNTLVFFTSDNVPELMRRSRGGIAGPLKCGKSTTYEGGMREPAIAYWPGTIKPGVTCEMTSTLDILPTLARLAGAELPQVMLDGVDMTDILVKQGKSKRETVMFYPVNPSEDYGLFAVRLGKYKAHFYTQGAFHSSTTPDKDCSALRKTHDPPLIFDLEADPCELYPVSEDESDIQSVLQQVKTVKEQFESSMVVQTTKNPKLDCCQEFCKRNL